MISHSLCGIDKHNSVNIVIVNYKIISGWIKIVTSLTIGELKVMISHRD